MHCRAGTRRHRSRRRWRLDDPHAVRTCRAELRDGVREGAEGIYVEDGIGVFAVLDAAFGEDDGDEVDAGTA